VECKNNRLLIPNFQHIYNAITWNADNSPTFYRGKRKFVLSSGSRREINMRHDIALVRTSTWRRSERTEVQLACAFFIFPNFSQYVTPQLILSNENSL
jgi:hypothetical protein